VIYYQLKFGLEKDHTNTSGAATGVSALLDDSWLSANSFLHHLCKMRKLKELLENNLGWEFQLTSAIDRIYFEEDDEKKRRKSEHRQQAKIEEWKKKCIN
ncbi:hypothetical protein CFP56_024474, partial [Quercus suber]